MSMDSGKHVVRELERRLKSDGEKAFRFTHICQAQELRVEFADIDRYSAVVMAIEVALIEPSAQTSRVASKQQALDLSERLSYLCNELNVLEIDSEHDCVQLRSALVEHDDGSRSYFELQLRGDFLSLHKYRVYNLQRKQTSFLLSHDVLARLVNDLLDDVAAA